MEPKDFRAGLFRHFKGSVIFADALMKGSDDEWYVHYCHALTPTMWYTRPLSEWDTDVTDRIGKDNITGQTHRFERLSSLSVPLARDVSTEQLMRELTNRKDSPLHGLDLEGLSSSIEAVDYCVGTYEAPTKDSGAGVYVYSAFETEEEAYQSFAFRNVSRAKVYKRTFIKVD